MRNCFHYINTFFMHEKKEESGGHASTVTSWREKNVKLCGFFFLTIKSWTQNYIISKLLHTSSKYSDQKISRVELKRKQKTAELSNSSVKTYDLHQVKSIKCLVLNV